MSAVGIRKCIWKIWKLFLWKRFRSGIYSSSDFCRSSMVQDNQESRCKYWATLARPFAHSLTSSLICLLHPACFACALRFAPLRSLVRPLAHSLPSLWKSKWLEGCFCCVSSSVLNHGAQVLWHLPLFFLFFCLSSSLFLSFFLFLCQKMILKLSLGAAKLGKAGKQEAMIIKMEVLSRLWMRLSPPALPLVG